MADEMAIMDWAVYRQAEAWPSVADAASAIGALMSG